jgi:hypothetical protein
MGGQANAFHATAHIPRMHAPQEVLDAWMLAACRAIYSLRLLKPVRLPDLLNLHRS